MPNLRELVTPLMLPDPPLAFDMVSSKYGYLTKLDLHLHTEPVLPAISLSSLQLPRLRMLWLTFPSRGLTPRFWNGQCGSTQLEEFHVKGCYQSEDEVLSMCRFFASTTIVSLLLKVHVLDGVLLTLLATSFPGLRDLSLSAASLASQRGILTQRNIVCISIATEYIVSTLMLCSSLLGRLRI